MIKTCPICGKQFTASHGRQKYCSRKCRDKFWNIKLHPKKPTLNSKTCVTCGKSFVPSRDWQVYCSDECRDNHWRGKPLEEKTCPVCGKHFMQRHWNQVFCSDSCNQKHRAKVRRAKRPVKYKICPHCGISFTSKQNGQKYCSDECRKANALLIVRRNHRKRHPVFFSMRVLKPLYKKSPQEIYSEKLVKAADAVGLDYGNYKAYLNLGYSHEQIKTRFGRRLP